MSHALAGSAIPPNFFAGTWVACFTLPVTHPSRASTAGNDIELLDDVIEIRGKIERVPADDGDYLDSFLPRMVTLPRYRVTMRGREATSHRLTLMQNVFNQNFFPAPPPYVLHSNMRNSFAFTSDAVVIAAGVQLDDPATADWTTTKRRGVDVDYDGSPGVTLVSALGNGLSPHPAGISQLRLTALHAAFRLRFYFTVEAKGTDVMTGELSCIGDGIDAHVFNVETSDGDGLVHREKDLLGIFNMTNDLRLTWTPSAKGSVSIIRASDTSDKAIREMEFP